MTPEALARQLFTAFVAGGATLARTDSGNARAWEELSDDIRARWVAAASRALALVPGVP